MPRTREEVDLLRQGELPQNLVNVEVCHVANSGLEKHEDSYVKMGRDAKTL
jgi:hypothetical protein